MNADMQSRILLSIVLYDCIGRWYRKIVLYYIVHKTSNAVNTVIYM